jgi:alpha-tubulin suppressor-like RCC1 family protein
MKRWRKKLQIVIVGIVISIIVFYVLITAVLMYLFNETPFYSQPMLGFYDLTDVAAGINYFIGLKSDGTVVAFGANNSGQCDVSEWTDIIAITTGAFHTVGLRADGTVVATCCNAAGQCNISDWSDIIAVSAAGHSHTAGLRADGTVVSTSVTINIAMSGWNDIITISAAENYVAGVRSDGTVILSEGHWSNFDVSDWYNIVAVEASAFFVVGLKSNGSVVTAAYQGERTPPIEAPDLSGWSDIVNISSGGIMGIKSDGTVVSLRSFTEFLNSPTDWHNITNISATNSNIIGLTAEGTVEVIWIAEQRRLVRQHGMGTWRRFIDDTWGEFSRTREAWGGQDPNSRRQRESFFGTLIGLIELRRR